MIAALKHTLLAAAVGAAVIASGNAMIASGNASASAVDLVQIDGSSTVSPLTEAMAKKFQKAEGGKTNVTVRVSGTGAGTDSGTYDYFAEAVIEGKSCRGDFTASEDDNVLVQGVSSDINALGFFGMAYYKDNVDKLKAVPISWKGGAPVAPSVENAKTGTYQPLSRPIFIYVSKKSIESKPHVNRFVEFYLDNGNARTTIKEVGYVPLPARGYDMAATKFKNRELGTVFHGSEVGIGIAKLMSREIE